MFKNRDRREDRDLETVLKSVPVAGCNKTDGIATKDGAGFGDGQFDSFARP